MGREPGRRPRGAGRGVRLLRPRRRAEGGLRGARAGGAGAQRGGGRGGGPAPAARAPRALRGQPAPRGAARGHRRGPRRRFGGGRPLNRETAKPYLSRINEEKEREEHTVYRSKFPPRSVRSCVPNFEFRSLGTTSRKANILNAELEKVERCLRVCEDVEAQLAAIES